MRLDDFVQASGSKVGQDLGRSGGPSDLHLPHAIRRAETEVNRWLAGAAIPHTGRDVIPLLPRIRVDFN